MSLRLGLNHGYITVRLGLGYDRDIMELNLLGELKEKVWLGS